LCIVMPMDVYDDVSVSRCFWPCVCGCVCAIVWLCLCVLLRDCDRLSYLCVCAYVVVTIVCVLVRRRCS